MVVVVVVVVVGVVMLHPVIYDYIEGVVSPYVNFASFNAFLISFSSITSSLSSNMCNVSN